MARIEIFERVSGVLNRKSKAPILDDVSNKIPADMLPIIGTVSQAAGVPTGAIIEKGSNANGEYTKFADGTMICRFYVSNLGSTPVLYKRDIVYPCAFVVEPQIVANLTVYKEPTYHKSSMAQMYFFAPMNIITATGCTISIFSHGIECSNVAQHMHAIGRWF